MKKTLLTFSSLFLSLLSITEMACATPVTPLCATAPNGLVGWWTGDQNANDIAGGHTGTFTGSYSAGYIGSAFVISGSGNDFVTVPQTSALEPANITVDAWVKASSSPGNFKYIAVKGGKGCDGGGSYALYTASTGGLAFYVYDGNTFVVSPVMNAASIWDGQWHFVAGTYDGTNVSLYVDGVLFGATPANLSINYSLNNNDFSIGAYQDCPSQNLAFAGNIDEVEIFSRALTSSEILTIFNAKESGKCNIDIKVRPLKPNHCFNPKNNGLISVAILGSSTLDVNNIDQTTLQFNGLSVKLNDEHKPLCRIEKVNQDGNPDLVCKFRNVPGAWSESQTNAVLTGKLKDHSHLIGYGDVCFHKKPKENHGHQS